METKQKHEETERRVGVLSRNTRMAERLSICVLIMHELMERGNLRSLKDSDRQLSEFCT